MNIKNPIYNRALTLIEVMLALSVLAMVSLTILSSVLLSRRLAESNVYENTALTVTQGYLEQIKSMEYDEPLKDPNKNLIFYFHLFLNKINYLYNWIVWKMK